MTEDHRLIKSAKSARDGNVSEATIPEDVIEFTVKMLDDCDIGWRHQSIDSDLAAKMVYGLILAENERCAKIAEGLVREAENDEEAGSSAWLCRVNVNSVSNHIAAAIRRR